MSQLETIVRPTSPASEAYRTVGVNLRYGGPEPRPKTILFTSAQRDDGRTSAIANVGVAIAQGNAHVVLLDADLRHPTLHGVFGLANTQGLTTLASGSSAEILVQETDVPG